MQLSIMQVIKQAALHESFYIVVNPEAFQWLPKPLTRVRTT